MVRLCTPQKNVDATKSQTSTSLQDELTKTLDTLHDLFDEIGLSSSAREGREESVYSALNAALQEQLDLVNEFVPVPRDSGSIENPTANDPTVRKKSLRKSAKSLSPR